MVNYLSKIILIILLFVSSPAFALEKVYTLVIKDHQFNPAQLDVPAYQKIKIIVENQDPTPEEFESFPLNREKIIPANSKGIIFLGPLKAGSYKFFGDFHQQTAQGVLVAK